MRSFAETGLEGPNPESWMVYEGVGWRSGKVVRVGRVFGAFFGRPDGFGS